MVVTTACVPSDLYSQVFHFLSSNGLTKAAKYFKKETHREYSPLEGPSLLDIFQEYLLVKGLDNHDVDGEDKCSGITHIKKKKRKLQGNDNDKCEKSSKKLKITEIVNDTGEVDKPEKSKKKKKDKKKKLEDETEEKPSEPVDNSAENTNIEVKNEYNDTNANVIAKEMVNVKTAQEKNVPFRRVKEECIFVPNQFRNNSFEAKRGSSGDWGEKANRDLKYTQGKSFRHEKTKKKRGSYRGGSINTSVNSIKFENSDDSE